MTYIMLHMLLFLLQAAGDEMEVESESVELDDVTPIYDVNIYYLEYICYTIYDVTHVTVSVIGCW